MKVNIVYDISSQTNSTFIYLDTIYHALFNK